MKKYFSLLFLFFQFIVSGLKAQTSHYFPFPEGNATWIEQYQFLNDLGFQQYAINKHTIVGDTTIDGIKLVKLLFYTSYSSPGHGTVQYYSQDTIAKKMMRVQDTVHGLIIDTMYNFSLKVGDSLQGKVMWDGYTSGLYIQSIDSILIGTNYRTRFNIVDRFGDIYPMSWIEGIGCTSALFDFPFHFITGGPDFQYSLICYQKDSQFLYTYPNYYGVDCNSIDSLYWTLTAIPVIVKSGYNAIIRVAPNPISDMSYITIEDRTILSYSLKIFNVSGRCIYGGTLAPWQRLYLKPLLLNSGLYFIKAISREGIILSSSFMVSRFLSY